MLIKNWRRAMSSIAIPFRHKMPCWIVCRCVDQESGKLCSRVDFVLCCTLPILLPSADDINDHLPFCSVTIMCPLWLRSLKVCQQRVKAYGGGVTPGYAVTERMSEPVEHEARNYSGCSHGFRLLGGCSRVKCDAFPRNKVLSLCCQILIRSVLHHYQLCITISISKIRKPQS